MVPSLCIPEEYPALGVATYETEVRSIDNWDAAFKLLEANGPPTNEFEATTHPEHLLEVSKRLSATPISILAPEAKKLKLNEIKSKDEAGLSVFDPEDIKLSADVDKGNLDEVFENLVCNYNGYEKL